MATGIGELRALAREVLGRATLPDVVVRVRARRLGHQRFFHGGPTTAGETERVDLEVTAGKDRRSATVAGVVHRAADAREVLARAEALARLAPEDPEAMPPVGRTRHPRVRTYDPAVARMAAGDRADLCAQAVQVALGRGLRPAGFCSTTVTQTVWMDSAGLDAQERATELSLSLTCRTSDGTGSSKGGVVSHRRKGLAVPAMAERVCETAERSRGPRGLAPGRYTVVLSVQAVADLLAFLRGAMGRRAADEGRSVFSRPGGGACLGESLFDARVRLWSDPTDRSHPSSAVGPGGLPIHPTVWVEGGRLVRLPVGRYWAKRIGEKPRAMGDSLFLAGETGTESDLVGKVDRGVFVTRFWYNRILDPKTLTVTGLTRDGTFWIEGGRLAGAVHNFRYNHSPMDVLRRIAGIGRAERAGLSPGVMVVPPLIVEDFHFSSVSEAV